MNLKQIPGTKGFLASDTGKVFSPGMKERKTYRNGDGYVTVSVLTEDGKWRTFGIHRLIALAFITPKEESSSLFVNHRDLNKENNKISNLEWVSAKENNIHNSLMRGSKSRPTIVASDEDGRCWFIDGIQKLSKNLKVDLGTAWDILRRQEKINGVRYCFYSCKDSIPENLKKKHTSLKNRVNGKVPPRRIKILDLRTSTVVIYESLADAAREHQTSPSHIYLAVIMDGKPRVFKKHFMVIDVDEQFPVMNDDIYQKLLQPLGKAVIAHSLRLNRTFLYESAKEFIRESGLSKKAVTTTLRKNKERLIDNWYFFYATEENKQRLKSILNVQK